MLRRPHTSSRPDEPGGVGPTRPRWARVAALASRDTQFLARDAGMPLAAIAATASLEGFASRLSARRHAGWSPRSWDELVLTFGDGLVRPGDLDYSRATFDPRWLGACLIPRGVRLFEPLDAHVSGRVALTTPRRTSHALAEAMERAAAVRRRALLADDTLVDPAPTRRRVVFQASS